MQPSPVAQPAPLPRHRLLLAMAYAGFVSLGLPDTLTGVAWPSVRDAFHLPQSGAGLLFITNACAYGLSGVLAGRALALLGTGALLAASGGLVAAAVFGFALSPGWWLFVAGAALHGLGSGAIDTALNHCASRLFTARHMNWLHACYSLGAAAGPAVMTAAVVRDNHWRAGYATIGGALLALTLLFTFTRRRWSAADAAVSSGEASTPRAPLRESLRVPAVRLQVLFFFLYGGIESTAGQWSFTLLRESRGFGAAGAGAMVTLYWSAILAGRIAAGFIVGRAGPDLLLRLGMAGAVAGAALLLAAGSSAFLCGTGLLLLGLSLAPLFPCLMDRTPHRAGEAHAANSIGLQVSASMLGVAVFPSLAGLLAQFGGPESIALLALALPAALCLSHELALRKKRG